MRAWSKLPVCSIPLGKNSKRWSSGEWTRSDNYFFTTDNRQMCIQYIHISLAFLAELFQTWHTFDGNNTFQDLFFFVIEELWAVIFFSEFETWYFFSFYLVWRTKKTLHVSICFFKFLILFINFVICMMQRRLFFCYTFFKQNHTL